MKVMWLKNVNSGKTETQLNVHILGIERVTRTQHDLEARFRGLRNKNLYTY